MGPARSGVVLGAYGALLIRLIAFDLTFTKPVIGELGIYLVASGLFYPNPDHTQWFWPAFVYGPFLILAARNARQSRGVDLSISLNLAEGDRI